MDQRPNQESFDAAVQRFKEFLRREGYPTRIAWIMPSDVLLTGTKLIYVRDPVGLEVENRARHEFEVGLAEHGVVLHALFFRDGTCYSHVWAPRNQTEVELGLVRPGIKLAATSSSDFQINVVQSPLRWGLLAIRYRSKQALRMQLFC